MAKKRETPNTQSGDTYSVQDSMLRILVILLICLAPYAAATTYQKIHTEKELSDMKSKYSNLMNTYNDQSRQVTQLSSEVTTLHSQVSSLQTQVAQKPQVVTQYVPQTTSSLGIECALDNIATSLGNPTLC